MNMVHVERSKYKIFSNILDFQSFGNSQKAERKYEVVIQDNFYESNNSDIVDLALGMGAAFLNINGIKTTEKLSKVLRYQTISKRLLAKISEPEQNVQEVEAEGEGAQNQENE